MALAPLPPRVGRVVYLGSPAAAVPPLDALLAEPELEVVAVVTGPDRRRGRRAAPSPTPVKERALAAGVPVHHDLDVLDELEVDLGVVVAFGSLIPTPVLERLPMVNLHFSLLPRWRGAAPVERAILAGDDVTGVCVMQVVEALDAGGVLAVQEYPIGPEVAAVELTERLAGVGAALLVETLLGTLPEPVPQSGEPCYAGKLHPEDRRVRWETGSTDVDRLVRVGGAWTMVGDQRLRIVEASVIDDPIELPASSVGDGSSRSGSGDVGFDRLPAKPGDVALVAGSVVVGTGSGWVVLHTVTPEGRRPQPAAAWLRSFGAGHVVHLGGSDS